MPFYAMGTKVQYTCDEAQWHANVYINISFSDGTINWNWYRESEKSSIFQ